MNNKTNSQPLVVSLNSNKVLEYYRDRKLSKSQEEDLEMMDEKLTAGIQVAGKFVPDPSPQEKALFVANQLAHALTSDNESVLAMTCAYLATRYPELKQIKLARVDKQLSIELINDKEYTEQAPIHFVPKKDL